MYHFIVNNTSGGGRSKRVWEELQNYLLEHEIRYKAHFTEYEGHAKKLADRVCDIDREKVYLIVVGGDGTLNEVLNGMHDFEKIRFNQGDLFLNGNEEESKALNYLGNTHGGMLNIGEAWYIFYHRQTNQHSYSRQACAEKLEHPAPGVFKQAEVTSCGLNGGPLSGTGRYEARIACNLWSKNGVARYDKKFDKKAHPYFTQTGKDRMENGDQYIANMRDGAVAGFKYFRFGGEKRISLTVSGVCSGIVEVSHTPDFKELIARLPVNAKASQVTVDGTFALQKGTQPLYFRYTGEGAMNFHTFEMR